MVLILSELSYDEIKNIDLYDYLYESKGFFDLTRGNKNKIVSRIKDIISYYRFYRTIPLNIIIMSDKHWLSICAERFKNSVHISCWCDVPEYVDITKRLDNSKIAWSDADINNLMEDVSNINFKQANLCVQLRLE